MDILFIPGAFAPWISLALAMLIGLLIGAERETARTNVHIGLRDFVVVSAMASVCALLDITWITVGMIVVLGAVLTVHHLREPSDAGLTTEVAMLATFVLAFLVSADGPVHYKQISVALAIVLTILLDAKPRVKRFFRETITEVELADTTRFLALIFVIYPLLPDGRFGPYESINPKGLWLAVVLVSGISFVGYFLEKFLGARAGERIAAILGGMVSTTAATQAFAQRARQEPSRTVDHWLAATMANAIQFIRVYIVLSILLPDLAWVLLWPMLGATATGLLIGLFAGRFRQSAAPSATLVGNPLRLMPAIQFAVFLAVVSLISKAAMDVYGHGVIYWTSVLGGLVDVDAITLNLADLTRSGSILPQTAGWALLVALASNVGVKTILSLTSGTTAFAWRMALSMFAMIGVAALVMAFTA